MLRDYLAVASDALSAQKEIYQVKEQRLRLAQQEYRQLNDAWRDKSTSQTSCEWRPKSKTSVCLILHERSALTSLCLRCDGQRRSAGVCDWCLQTTLMWEQEEERLILLASHSVTVTAVITHSYMWSWEKCQKQSSVQENNKKNIER